MIQTNFKKGDIVWVDLGPISNSVGHEQALKRPCIVIKDFPSLGMSTVLPLTSKAKAFYSVVKIEKSDTGMTSDSYALCHQLRAISHSRIKNKQAALSSRAFNKIRSVLMDILELT